MTTFALPLMRATPRRMASEEVDAFARRTGWVDDIGVIKPGSSTVEALQLPWWDGVELVTVHDSNWHGDSVVAAWLLDGRLLRLDGKSQPIHEMNGRRAPRLDAANVLSYLGFFCFFVRGDDGPFAIIESVEDPLLPAAASSVDLRDKLRPAVMLEQKEDGFHCEATVWYSDAFFLSNFVVKASGMVEMLDDEPLLVDTGLRLGMPFVFKQDDGPSTDGQPS